jgi:hypothetical protein
MADHSLPTLSSLYADFLSYLKARDDDAVRLNDTRVTAATNLPDYAKRWNETLGVFQNWLSGAWGALRLAVAGGGTGADNAADARTNLGAASSTDLSTHIADQASPHGATSAATASKTMARDGSGRAKVAAPSASDDIARKQEVDDHAALTNPHSATAAATASRLMLRDSAGRAAVATPSASGDIATKGYVDGLVPTLASGTYTPSLTNGANVAASTAFQCQYIRVGSVVHVSGQVNIDPTSAGVLTTLYMSLPVASNLAQAYNLAGAAVCSGEGYNPVIVAGEPTTDKAALQWIPTTDANRPIVFSFTYVII